MVGCKRHRNTHTHTHKLTTIKRMYIFSVLPLLLILCMSLSFDDSLMKFLSIFCALRWTKKMRKTSTPTNCIVEKLGVADRPNGWLYQYTLFSDGVYLLFTNIQQTIKCYNIITIAMALYHNRQPDFQSYAIITSVCTCL